MIQNDSLTESAIARYTEGLCWQLAYYISLKSNLPVVVIEHPHPDGRDSKIFVHSYVRMPDGSLLDAEGVHQDSEALEEWAEYMSPVLNGPGELVERDREKLYEQMIFHEPQSKSSEESARIVADHLIKKYVLQ